jgi:hypothetical protein
MRRFMFLMHGDTTTTEDFEAWGPYLSNLQSGGHFDGGSSIGSGETYRTRPKPQPLSELAGYFIVGVEDLAGARAFLRDNPTYVAGGTVEIRELIED